MTEILFAGIVHAAHVFFRAFQQRNVAFLHYAWVAPLSYAMSFSDVIIMSVVTVRTVTAANTVGWTFGLIVELLPLILVLGSGGWMGSMSAMWIHSRYLGVKKDGAT